MGRKKRKRITEETGRELYERIMLRDSGIGGITFEALGIPGSGKTSLLLSFVDDIIDRYPTEKIFFRDSYQSQCQFNRFDRWHVFADFNIKLQFMNVDTGKIEDVSITLFRDFNELLDFAKPKQLNVVYLKNDYRYIDFIRFLRLTPGWQTFVIDEYEDLAPLYGKGLQWKKNLEMSFEFKHIRRGLLNVLCDTQNPFDVDWRVRGKIMSHGYLQGSCVDSRSPIDQKAVNKLDIGEVYVDFGHARFGKGYFSPYEPRHPIMVATNLNNGV